MIKIALGIIPSYFILFPLMEISLRKIPGLSESLGYELIYYFIIVFFAWIIGALLLKISKISIRIITVILLTFIGFILVILI